MLKGTSSGYEGPLLSVEEQLDYHDRKEAGKGDGHEAAFMFGTLGEDKQTQLS